MIMVSLSGLNKPNMLYISSTDSLKIMTSFNKYFFRDSNSSVITDYKFLKQFSTLK